MSIKNSAATALFMLVLLGTSTGSRSDVFFDCIYGPTPLEYGANPTIYSEFELSNPQLGNLFYAVSVSIANTATSGGDTVGPVLIQRNKPAPPPGVWKVQNVFAFPPYSATWNVTGVATWINVICVGGSCFHDPQSDFCAAQALISSPGGGGGGCYVTSPVTSSLPLSGRPQRSPTQVRNAPLTAQRLAEDGRSVVADEISVRWDVGVPTLQIRHQAAHPDNENYAPAPVVRLLPQRVQWTNARDGQRGFAIAEIGQTGAVTKVRAISASGPAASPGIEAAIAQGIQTKFADQRRHDHTAYLAYEVRRGVLRSVGQGLVTMPMCCPVCPGYPDCY